jgi:hypothetical protein
MTTLSLVQRWIPRRVRLSSVERELDKLRKRAADAEMLLAQSKDIDNDDAVTLFREATKTYIRYIDGEC